VRFYNYVLAKKALLYEKRSHKILIKFTKGVDFTNILQAAFTPTDPKSAKDSDITRVFFRFWDIPTLYMLQAFAEIRHLQKSGICRNQAFPEILRQFQKCLGN